MPARKRTVRTIAIAATLVLVLTFATAAFWIDAAARAGVETGATYALGVNTTLASMNVGILAGSVAMADLQVANPAGFETEHFLALADGKVAVSLGSLMADKVVVTELTLSGLTMNLERRNGKANYAPILDSLKRFESAEKASEPAKERPTEGGKTFVIEKLTIEDVKVNVELLPIGGEVSRIPVTIPALELTNVGSDTVNGIQMAEVVDIVVKAILSAVLENTGNLLPADIAGELQNGLKELEALSGQAVKIVGSVTTEAGKVVEELGKVGQDAGKGIEEGIGNLFGNKKNEKNGD